jgi:hypothetical protein
MAVIENDEAGKKSGDWSMNLRRADQAGQSSAEAGVWR